MKNYYKILGVTSNCTQAEIKKAYRTLALQHHPDKNSGDTASEERFKAIAESYSVLGDTAKRNAYDYAKGHRKNYYGQDVASGQATSATYLMLFKNIKAKVLNAGGYINEYALFKVINDVLTDSNVAFLVRSGDVNTNNLIIDEILVSCIFLGDTHKAAIYAQLLTLADSDPKVIEKIAALKKRTDKAPHPKPEAKTTPPSAFAILFFVLFVVLLIIVVVM